MNCLLNLNILYHSEAAVSIQLSNKKSQVLTQNFCIMHKCALLKDNPVHFFYKLSVTPVIIQNHEQKKIFSFLASKQKCLTGGFDSAIISLNLLYGKCVGAERVVGTMTAESCRVVRGNSRESDEVHSVSSVLKQ